MISVSACISAYNRPEYCIKAVLTSITNQTKQPDEVVLVDDGSSIPTAREAYEAFKDKLNIKYIWNNNPGNTANTLGNNIAVKNATSDYLLIISADVCLNSFATEEVTSIHSQQDKTIIGLPVWSLTVSGTKKFLELGQPTFVEKFTKGQLSIRDLNLPITEESRLGPEDILACYQQAGQKQVNYFACSLPRKEFIEIGGFNEDYSILGGWEDQDFKSRTALVFQPQWIKSPSFHLGHWYDTPEYFKPKQDPNWGKPELRTNRTIPIWTSPYANINQEWGKIRV